MQCWLRVLSPDKTMTVQRFFPLFFPRFPKQGNIKNHIQHFGRTVFSASEIWCLKLNTSNILVVVFSRVPWRLVTTRDFSRDWDQDIHRPFMMILYFFPELKKILQDQVFGGSCERIGRLRRCLDPPKCLPPLASTRGGRKLDV